MHAPWTFRHPPAWLRAWAWMENLFHLCRSYAYTVDYCNPATAWTLLNTIGNKVWPNFCCYNDPCKKTSWFGSIVLNDSSHLWKSFVNTKQAILIFKIYSAICPTGYTAYLWCRTSESSGVDRGGDISLQYLTRGMAYVFIPPNVVKSKQYFDLSLQIFSQNQQILLQKRCDF